MAQILPPRYNLGSQIGESLQQGFQKGFDPAIQQQYQRGQLQNALGSLDNIPQNATPAEIGKYLLSATAGLPDQGRILGALYGPMVQQAQARNAPSVEDIVASQGAQGIPNGMQQSQPLPQFLQKQANQPFQQGVQPNLTTPTQGVGLNLGTYIPTDVGTLVTPETQSKILKQIQLQGGDVDFARQQIKDYNEGKINFQDLQNTNVDKQAAQVAKQLKMEGQVKDFIDRQVDPKTPEAEKNIFYNLMKEELPNHNDLTGAYQAASKKIANFGEMKDKYIKNIPDVTGGPTYPGIQEPQEKILRSAAQNLLKVDPLAYNVLESAYTQKGHSIVTPAKILNPLPPKVEGVAKSAPDYREQLYPSGFVSNFFKGDQGNSGFQERSDREMMANIAKVQAEQDKEAPKIAKKLVKDWDKSISLINLYSDFKSKGWFPEQIYSIFNDIKEGGADFGSQQEKEMTQLVQPPRIPLRYLNE